MKPTFTDLDLEQRLNYGDGCTFVPDFIFTANCRHHDFNYARGGWLIDKFKADWDMCRLMFGDSSLWWHYVVTVIYWLGLTLLPFSYFFFYWGRYNDLDTILEIDTMI
jgi:hypothetical protein